MDNNRNLFTNHGLCLNKLGKQLVNHQIASLLLTTFGQTSSSPIIVSWHETQNNNNQTCDVNQVNPSNRNSVNNKKMPVTRSNDFFMANLSTNQTDENNIFNVNRHISCKTSEYFELNYYTVYKNHNQLLNNFMYDDHNTTKFVLLHQNIRGISNKIDEFLILLSSNAPQVICLTEHRLMTEETGNVNISQYTLGASFCRQTYKHGGACIYVSKDIQFKTINLD